MEAREPHDGPATAPTGTPPGVPAMPAAPAAGPSWRLRPEDDAPPPRPASLAPAELGFTPQPATRWFNPGVLTAAGLHEGVTSVFGSFLDKRELQTAKPCEVDTRYAGHDELWIDYVADTGDGFDATATVACQVAKPGLAADELVVDGRVADRLPAGALPDRLPRGEILVLGGDEVYPSASVEGYENRLEGPWRAALSWTDPRPTEPAHPTVYAIPGNHDWYDGLTGFLRQFGQDRWLGGWRTHQTRSYFAVELPHHWWLWGIDIQPDALIDEPQLRFFSDVARSATPGDRLILATAVPEWTRLERDPLAFRNLAYLERTLLVPSGIRLELTVAGDAHHYARYEQQPGEGTAGPTHKITSGGGGAFLHPTHDLPREVDLKLDPGKPGASGRAADTGGFELSARYPSRGRSYLLSSAALSLPWRNRGFLVIPGLVSVAMLWTVQFGLRSLQRDGLTFADAAGSWAWSDVAGGIFRNSLSAVMVLVLYGGLVAFARPPARLHGAVRWLARLVMAALHLGLQIVTVATVCLVAVELASNADGWWFAVAASLVAALLGAVAGSLAMGLYLAVAIAMPGMHAHANEAFAAARLTGYRNFLRLHIDRAGGLTVFALGIDRAVKRWRAVPQADGPEVSWIAPDGDEPTIRLIDTVRFESSEVAGDGSSR